MQDLVIPQFKQEKKYGCIPACLQQVFAYYDKEVSQEEILNSLDKPERGMSVPAAGTFAKRSGFNPTIVTNNMDIFDPTWFDVGSEKLIQHLKEKKSSLDEYNKSVVEDFLEYLEIGGQIGFDTIDSELFVRSLSNKVPVIIELSSTDLYKKKDSGEIEGHGVVIAGFDGDKVKVVDPDRDNPYDKTGVYWIPISDIMMSFSALDGKSVLLIS